MSGGFATAEGDGRDVRAGRDVVILEGARGLRTRFDPTAEYAGLQTCGDCAFMIGDSVVELE